MFSVLERIVGIWYGTKHETHDDPYPPGAYVLVRKGKL